jgi:formylglycine-generating enzyme required for sulfatase activity
VGGRLPTEAEWEYAARAGSVKSRSGDIDRIAWYYANSGEHTHDVAQKEPNAWGLYDMLGNVEQWVSDWFGIYPPGAQTDPSGPASGQKRALRGSSCNYNPRDVRVSYRFGSKPGEQIFVIGFRCAGK